MIRLTAEQATDYYRRSYNAVDGLWFMKVEEAHDFEAALAADNAVWQVLPKIQARKLKEMAKLGNGLEALREALAAKLTLDGYAHRIEANAGDDGAFTLTIEDCPWLAVMSRTAASMPCFICTGFTPATTALRPSRKIASAMMVAVVVPSPATSDVLLATSRTICAPMFS